MATYSSINFVDEERQRFRRCCYKLQSLVPDKDSQYAQELNRVLDELNSLDYSIPGLIDQVINYVYKIRCKIWKLVMNHLYYGLVSI